MEQEEEVRREASRMRAINKKNEEEKIALQDALKEAGIVYTEDEDKDPDVEKIISTFFNDTSSIKDENYQRRDDMNKLGYNDKERDFIDNRWKYRILPEIRKIIEEYKKEKPDSFKKAVDGLSNSSSFGAGPITYPSETTNLKKNVESHFLYKPPNGKPTRPGDPKYDLSGYLPQRYTSSSMYGGSKSSKKRPTRRRRSSKARKSRKTRTTRRR